MQMHDRNDGRGRAVDDEESAERESIQDRASDVRRDQRELKRPLRNPPEGLPNGLNELRTETRPFGFVPESCFEGVQLRFGPNAEYVYLRAERRRPSRRSRTSPHGLASPGAARCAASRSSSI